MSGSPPTQPKTEAGAADDNTLTLTVSDQHGAKTYFKIRPDTRLGKVFGAYSRRRGVDVSSLRFTFEGHRIQHDDTPAKLDIEDGDQVDVFQEQTGGC
mmetsp:Transcript_34389/g.50530  ORF Transcript_34389/g.50530 Transcript_34389/m.50530 type:complete len:98 (-) Transcript_34389:87-380(-)|eukprot:CAMPEP_0195517746 /NCGR_PEP_ID=MMETSP0794_2-20130614/11540_1 /TAXON_ID=515487 /ORGANISM="Stephanopyxis turris, Strain CCMP 815" /LENGTH=97 /DNA_ID=CAMNT_0040646615 /DNA_START=40 /DNA_END=333 /DNA_ORIENTATION=+